MGSLQRCDLVEYEWSDTPLEDAEFMERLTRFGHQTGVAGSIHEQNNKLLMLPDHHGCRRITDHAARIDPSDGCNIRFGHEQQPAIETLTHELKQLGIVRKGPIHVDRPLIHAAVEGSEIGHADTWHAHSVIRLRPRQT